MYVLCHVITLFLSPEQKRSVRMAKEKMALDLPPASFDPLAFSQCWAALHHDFVGEGAVTSTAADDLQSTFKGGN